VGEAVGTGSGSGLGVGVPVGEGRGCGAGVGVAVGVGSCEWRGSALVKIRADKCIEAASIKTRINIGRSVESSFFIAEFLSLALCLSNEQRRVRLRFKEVKHFRSSFIPGDRKQADCLRGLKPMPSHDKSFVRLWLSTPFPSQQQTPLRPTLSVWYW